MSEPRSTARELAPVWWAVRAYVAVGLTAILLGIDWSVQHPALPRFGSAAGTALVPALALAGSLALGLRNRDAHGGPHRALIALNPIAADDGRVEAGALLVAAVPVLDRATDAPPT